jgi:ubiquinone/menaquinone biosynthesis C-methylase UbiE
MVHPIEKIRLSLDDFQSLHKYDSPMEKLSNLFGQRAEAQRYHLYRPVYHPILARELLKYFEHRIPTVLDVGCGTGHSTKALGEISDLIIGCDMSEEMLREARKDSEIPFIQSPAEELPFGPSEFDYLNVSMAYHWFDQSRFLNEARRVLKPDGILGIDNYGFTGTMNGRDDFKEKYKAFDNQFMKAAPRNRDYPEEEDLKTSGFKSLHEITYNHEVTMNTVQFVNYLMTRSNFLQLTEEVRAEVEEKLEPYYRELFQNAWQTLQFRGRINLYKRVND